MISIGPLEDNQDVINYQDVEKTIIVDSLQEKDLAQIQESHIL